MEDAVCLSCSVLPVHVSYFVKFAVCVWKVSSMRLYTYMYQHFSRFRMNSIIYSVLLNHAIMHVRYHLMKELYASTKRILAHYLDPPTVGMNRDNVLQDWTGLAELMNLEPQVE